LREVWVVIRGGLQEKKGRMGKQGGVPRRNQCMSEPSQEEWQMQGHNGGDSLNV
jgi:hypothetical protein